MKFRWHMKVKENNCIVKVKTWNTFIFNTGNMHRITLMDDTFHLCFDCSEENTIIEPTFNELVEFRRGLNKNLK